MTRLLYLILLVFCHELNAQKVNRIWMNDQRACLLGIVAGVEIDNFTTKLSGLEDNHVRFPVVTRAHVSPCVGIEFSYKMGQYLSFLVSPLVRFSKSKIVLDAQSVDDMHRGVDYKWGSIVFPLCLKIKGEAIKNTRPLLYIGGFGLINPCKDPIKDFVSKKWMSCGVQLGVGWELPTRYVTIVPEIVLRIALTDVFCIKSKSLYEFSQAKLIKTSDVYMNTISFTLNFE